MDIYCVPSTTSVGNDVYQLIHRYVVDTNPATTEWFNLFYTDDFIKLKGFDFLGVRLTGIMKTCFFMIFYGRLVLNDKKIFLVTNSASQYYVDLMHSRFQYY